MKDKNIKDIQVSVSGFNQEELEEAIDDQKVQIKRENFRVKIKEINNRLSKTKIFNFAKGKVWPILLPFFVVMSFLVVLPLILIVIYAIVQPADGIKLFRISIEKFITLFTDNDLMISLLLSIAYAFVSGFMCVLMGYPIALIMSKMRSKILARNMWVIVTMPMWISMLLKVLGLRSLFYLFAASSIGTPIAMVIGMTYMFLPFAIAPIYDSLESRPRDLEHAAQDLGCSPFKTFWTITLRSSMPGVLTGFSLVLVQAATSLIVVHYMGDGKINLIAQAIESYFFQGSDFGFGAAISVVLAIMVFAIIIIMKLLSNKFEVRGGKKNEKILKK